MTFENTVWLYLTPVLVLFAGGFIALGLRRRDALLRRFAAARLVARLARRAAPKRTAVKAALVLAAVAGIGLALARPQYGVEWTRREARGLDLVFALDVSRSMLAEDLMPTRLERAKLAITDLIRRLESDRIGLVAFAGRAFLQTPPTLDYAAFRESLRAVDPSIISRGGSDIGQALREAAEAFPNGDNTRIVVLLTDGEALEGGVKEAAKAAADAGITVHTVGVGTPEGEYLRVRGEDGGSRFVRNAEGQPVRSRLDESTLREIAGITGGEYGRLDAGTMRRLNETVLAALPRSERESELRERPIERFQWPLLAAFLFLVGESLVRRRSGAATTTAPALLAAGFLLAIPSAPLRAQEAPPDAPPASAPAEKTPADDAGEPSAPASPRRTYNRGVEALRSGNLATARDRFENAIERTDDLRLQRDALYNLGHAAFRTGETAFRKQAFREAIDHWKEAESLFRSANGIDGDQAAAEDAAKVKKRREALEKFLERQQEQQQNQRQNGEPQQDGKQGENADRNKDNGQSRSSGDSDEQPGDSGQQSQSGQQGQQGQSGQQGNSGQQGQPMEPGESGNGQDGQSGQNQSRSGQSGQENTPSGNAGDGRGQPSDPASENAGGPNDTQPEPENPGNDAAGGDRQNDQRPRNDGATGAGDPRERTPEPGQDDAGGQLPDARDGEEETPKDNGTTAAGDTSGAGETDGGEDARTGAATGQTTEGMSETEARALLDSLRGTERILPFVEPSEREGPGRPVRDW